MRDKQTLAADETFLDDQLRRCLDAQEQGAATATYSVERPELSAELARRLHFLDWIERVRAELSTGTAGEDETVNAPPAEGSMLPKLKGYEFEQRLGHGAHGEVWRARNIVLDARRAIKLLAPDRRTPANGDRLVEEGRKMARLPRHPNRVVVHELVPGVTNCFLIMEYIEGGSLHAQTSPEHPLPWERAVRYAADVADALADLHAAGILHRDLKPSNLLWDRARDEVLLADYGIASYVTEAGRIAGTIGYLAPELGEGQVAPAADVFSLAATLFHLVTGAPPFDGETIVSSILQAQAGLRRPVEALRNVPQVVEDVILAGLEPDPKQRVDLETFRCRLRGAYLQSLADRLLELARRSACRVRLDVAVATASEATLAFHTVPCEVRGAATRNLELVPEPAPEAAVHTGALVRLEVTADTDGYLTVLNLGSSGDLHVLFPNPAVRDNRLQAGRAQRLTVKLTPPAGVDRAAVIWTRQPSGLSPADWRERLEAGEAVAAKTRAATRGMDFVLHEAQISAEWTAKVVSIAHTTP